MLLINRKLIDLNPCKPTAVFNTRYLVLIVSKDVRRQHSHPFTDGDFALGMA